jgi:hypothetical protein
MANRLGFSDTDHLCRAIRAVAIVTTVLAVWGVLEVRRVAEDCLSRNGYATTRHDEGESEAILCVVPGMALP